MNKTQLLTRGINNLSTGASIGSQVGGIIGGLTGIGPLGSIGGAVAGAGIGNAVTAYQYLKNPNGNTYQPQTAIFARMGAELEKQETVLRPDQNLLSFNGPTHEQGGFNYNPKYNSEFVFSDSVGFNSKNKLSLTPNKTFAQLSKKFQGKDPISQNTLQALKQDNKRILQMFQAPQFRYGGNPPKYALGGTPTDPPGWNSSTDYTPERMADLERRVQHLDNMRRNTNFTVDQRVAYEQDWIRMNRQLQRAQSILRDQERASNKGIMLNSPPVAEGTFQYGQGPNPYEYGTMDYRMWNQAKTRAVNPAQPTDPSTDLRPPITNMAQTSLPMKSLDYTPGAGLRQNQTRPFSLPKTNTPGLAMAGMAAAAGNPMGDPLGFRDTFVGGRQYPMSYNEAPDNNQFVNQPVTSTSGGLGGLTYTPGKPPSGQFNDRYFGLYGNGQAQLQQTTIPTTPQATPQAAGGTGGTGGGGRGTRSVAKTTTRVPTIQTSRYKNALQTLATQGGLDPNLLNTPAGVKKIQGFLADGKSYFGKIDGIAGDGTAAGLGQWAMVSNPPRDPNAINLQAPSLTAPQVNPYTPQQLNAIATGPTPNATTGDGTTGGAGLGNFGDWLNGNYGRNASALLKVPGTAYNLIKGLQKPEEVPLRLNRQMDDSINLMANRKYDPEAAYQAITRQTNSARAMTQGSNPFLNNAQNQTITNSAQAAAAQANLAGQEMNNQYRAQEAATRAQLGSEEAGIRRENDMMQLRSKAARNSFLQQSFQDMSAIGDAINQGKVTQAQIKEGMAILKQFYPNVDINWKEINSKLEKGEDLSDVELYKLQMMSQLAGIQSGNNTKT